MRLIAGSVTGPTSGDNMIKLFDQTLGASSNTIDTGANGVAPGYSGLLIYVRGRRDDAVYSGGFDLWFNNDTATNYDFLWTDNSNGTIAGTVTNTVNGAKVMEGPGANIRANTFGVANVWIPGYADTNAYKSCTSLGGFTDGSTHGELVHAVSSWNNTAAINRIALFVSPGVNMISGSRMTIWGLT